VEKPVLPELAVQAPYPGHFGFTLRGAFFLNDAPLFEKLLLEVGCAQWTCLLGPSGIGKSTLLRLCAGLPTHGRFAGSITTSDGEPIAGRISYMAQSDLLFPWLDVRQNVLLGQRLRREPASVNRADDLIHQVGLRQHAHKRPHQLSGGMRQRVALARTLMEDKPVVLLDEPFSALDFRTRSEMQDLAFNSLSGKTVLLVTHDPAEAIRLSHQLYVMSEQGMLSYDTPETIPVRALDHPTTLEAQARLLSVLRS
jgi:putative hydroxymethylpyrimidine transport system ATP-binding protein